MKTISPEILAGLSVGTVRVIYLVRIHFTSGTVAWNSGFRDIAFDGVDYLGLGGLTSISTNTERPGVTAAGLTVGVSGIQPEIVSLFLSEPYINREAYIHYTLLDENDEQIPGDPVLMFRGSIASVNGEMGVSAGFTIEIKSRLDDWERDRKIRYTDSEQQKLHPGDKGFEFVGQMEQRKIIWPRAAFLPTQG